VAAAVLAEVADSEASVEVVLAVVVLVEAGKAIMLLMNIFSTFVVLKQ